MFGRELRLPDQIHTRARTHTHEYVIRVEKKLKQAYEEGLQQSQTHTLQEDREGPLPFATGDMVWLGNGRRTKGSNPKLQPIFMGPNHIKQAHPNHTYPVEWQGQISLQNECRLKRYHPNNAVGTNAHHNRAKDKDQLEKISEETLYWTRIYRKQSRWI